MKTDTQPENPPAFAHAGIPSNFRATAQQGMSLRDWFAGQALIALLHPTFAKATHAAREEGESVVQNLAAVAYAAADAMLAARQGGDQ